MNNNLQPDVGHLISSLFCSAKQTFVFLPPDILKFLYEANDPKFCLVPLSPQIV